MQSFERAASESVRRGSSIAALALVVAATLVAAGCRGDTAESSDAAATLPPSSCTPLEYGGAGKPDVLLVSDLPLQGPSRGRATQMAEAVRFELEQRGWQAGAWRVGFHSCDDSTIERGAWDPGRCDENARAYAAHPTVVGVVGTLDSGCAAIVIPVLNKATGGGIAMVSPANTYTCLTRRGPGCVQGELAKFYPAGVRNYLRVIGNDVYQGAAMAEFMRQRGVKRLYVLHDGESYGFGVATAIRRAAAALGIEVVGFAAWDSREKSYEALFRDVGRARPDAVFLGGLIERNGAQVIRDKVAVLGKNDGAVRLFASDGFTTRRTTTEAGAAADGMLTSVAGVTTAAFRDRARRFVDAFRAQRLGGGKVDPYAVYAAEAARRVLDAIASSDGTRAGVIAGLFRTKVADGLLGSYRFDRNGDPVGARGPVVGFTIYRADAELTPEAVVWPDPSTVRAAAASQASEPTTSGG
jgi:branched-chain amino acid transport system substrate-binding protein